MKGSYRQSGDFQRLCRQERGWGKKGGEVHLFDDEESLGGSRHVVTRWAETGISRTTKEGMEQ